MRKLSAFLYLGTPCGPLKGLVAHTSEDHLTTWGPRLSVATAISVKIEHLI